MQDFTAEISRLEDALLRLCPTRQWEVVEVTFPSTPGVALDIPHSLSPSRPELVDWMVVQQVRPGIVFQPVNKPFVDGVVKLASTTPSQSATIVLSVGDAGSRTPLLGASLDSAVVGFIPSSFSVGGVTIGELSQSVGVNYRGVVFSSWAIIERAAVAPSITGVHELTFWDFSESTTFPIFRIYEDAGGAYTISPGSSGRSVTLGAVSGTNTNEFAGLLVDTVVVGDTVTADKVVVGAAPATFGSQALIGDTNPILDFYESDAGSNQKFWRWTVDGAQFLLQTLPDNYSSSTDLLRFDRSGNAFYTGALVTPQHFRFDERSDNPGTPADGTQVHMYLKDNKLILHFNDGGTERWKYLDLTGTGVTWVHTTSAP